MTHLIIELTARSLDTTFADWYSVCHHEPVPQLYELSLRLKLIDFQEHSFVLLDLDPVTQTPQSPVQFFERIVRDNYLTDGVTAVETQDHLKPILVLSHQLINGKDFERLKKEQKRVLVEDEDFANYVMGVYGVWGVNG